MEGTVRRRTDRERTRHNCLFWWDRKLQDRRAQGSLIDTPSPSTCWMCGNPRRYLGELTMRERRWIQEVDDES